MTEPQVTMREKLHSGLMESTLWRRCHGDDETARVHRVRCRVVFGGKFKASSGLDRDRASSHDAEAMAGTFACV